MRLPTTTACSKKKRREKRTQLPRCQHAKKLQRQSDLISPSPWHPVRVKSVWRRPVVSGAMRLRACLLFRCDATYGNGGGVNLSGSGLRRTGLDRGSGCWVQVFPPSQKTHRQLAPVGSRRYHRTSNAHPSPSAHARVESPTDGPVAPRWGAGARLRP